MNLKKNLPISSSEDFFRNIFDLKIFLKNSSDFRTLFKGFSKNSCRDFFSSILLRMPPGTNLKIPPIFFFNDSNDSRAKKLISSSISPWVPLSIHLKIPSRVTSEVPSRIPLKLPVTIPPKCENSHPKYSGFFYKNFCTNVYKKNVHSKVNTCNHENKIHS